MLPVIRRWLDAAIPLIFGIGILLLGGIAYWFFSTPTHLTVAVASQDDAEARVIVAFARALKDLKKDIRLDVVMSNTVAETALALQQKKVDLAVVRPDVFLPNDGLTMAILREEAVIIVAPSDNIAGLRGKRIGVVVNHDSDLALIRDILAFYDIKTPDVALLPLAATAIAESFQSKAIDALAVIAPVGQVTAGLVSTAIKAAGHEMALVPLDQGAIAAVEPSILQEVNVPEGSFGGQPPQPAQDLSTIGTSYLLMAQGAASRSSVSELTEYLFRLRARIAKSAPAIDLMKAPDEDSVMSAKLPIHPGAIDYLTRDQETFMDRYGDWIWLGLFFGGGASSAAAWTFQYFARRQRERIDEVLDRLLSILNDARSAEDPARLDALSCEIDALVIKAVRQTHIGATDTNTMGALILAIDAARAAVADQRRRSGIEQEHQNSRGLQIVRSMRDES